MLKKRLQNYDVNIQHVGSTSIVGCCAKPIIDIAIGVESLEKDFYDNRDNYALGKDPFIEKIVEIAVNEKSMSKQN